jgi:ABC-type lipoprotein export system ATPase subunit
MSKSSSGSEWRKWDLHIHTPFSIKQNYPNTDKGWAKFINALENLPKEVDVIGITDYYFIDGYKKVMEYKKQGRLSNLVKIFPILEFRIDTFGSSNENKLQKINLHILFDIDESKLSEEIKKIEDEFIGLIPISSLDRFKTKMLSKENLTVEGGDNLSNGFESLVPPTNKVFELIDSTQWSNNTFLFLGYKEWSNLEKNQQVKPIKQELFDRVGAFFSNNSDNIENNQSWLNQYGNKRLLHSLDIHGFDLLDTYEFNENQKLAPQKYHCNTWVKADPTFEGLKQIVFEPNDRVMIQSSRPDYKEEKLIIDEVRYYSADNSFSSNPIKLNQNLNVIIGGKSSGKSILLYHIAKTLETNDEVTSIANDKYNFRSKDLFFDFEVKSFSGVSQKMHQSSENSIIPNSKYIPQNYLSQLAEPKDNKKGGELLRYVRGLLLEDDSYKQKYREFLDKVKLNDRKRDEIIDNYFSIKETIAEKGRELKLQGNEEVLIKSVESNKLRVADLKKGMGLSAQDVELYNLKKTQLEKIKSDRSKIANDFKEARSFNEESYESLVDLLKRKDLISNSILTEVIRKEFTDQYKNLSETIQGLKNWKQVHEISEGKFKNLNSINTLLVKLNEDEIRLEKEIEPFIKDEKVKKEIADIEKIISADGSKILLIEKLKKEIQLHIEELAKEKRKLFENYLINFSEYGVIIEALKSRTQLPEENNLEIEGSVKFNAYKFRNSLLDVSDGRSFPSEAYNLLQEKENLILFDQENHLIQLKGLFTSIVEEGTYNLSSKSNVKSAVKILLSDYFVDYWETIYDGDKMEEMSTGKASFVILMLIIGLSSSKAPILIDQPEDNLDNRSITKDLVKYLRDKKLERQIILVTHNPNVVVNADAENIIVAHQKGQNDKETSSDYTFDYINGAIENSKNHDVNELDLLKSMGIREHIADIVEGGKVAFQKREEKYGFN